MVSLIDVTAFPGIFGSIVQFGGLEFAGIVASLSKSTNASMKNPFFAWHSKLSFALNKLMQAGIVIDRPFFVATMNGHVTAVSAFLAAGAVVDLANHNGWTLLNSAAHNGQEKCAELLLGARAAVDLANNKGWTPLNSAAQNGQEKCVALLLGARAAVDLANSNGFTPLNNAAQEGQEKSVALLLDARAAVDLANNRGVTKE